MPELDARFGKRSDNQPIALRTALSVGISDVDGENTEAVEIVVPRSRQGQPLADPRALLFRTGDHVKRQRERCWVSVRDRPRAFASPAATCSPAPGAESRAIHATKA